MPTNSASSPESPNGAAGSRRPVVDRQIVRFPAGIEDNAAESAQRSLGLRLAKCGRFLRAAGHPEHDSLAAGQLLLAANAEGWPAKCGPTSALTEN